MKNLAMPAILIGLAACSAGDGTGLDANGQPIAPQQPAPPDAPEPPTQADALQPTLSAIQDQVLTPICTQCHAGPNAPLGLRMDDLATSQANLIDVDAATDASFKRVEPGNPERSFFYLKVIGDPIAGARMPLGQAPLPDATLEVIRQWITAGAPIDNNQLLVTSKGIAQKNQQRQVGLTFSQPIDPASLRAADMQLSVNDGEFEYPLTGLQLSWTAADHLTITLPSKLATGSTVTLRFNQPQLSSVLSTTGVWLDGDRDGFAGGEVQYDYIIKE